MSEIDAHTHIYVVHLTIMDRVWAPQVIEDLSDSDLLLYLQFSKSACIRGGGRGNLDRALQVLYRANGDIKRAVEGLLTENKQTSHWTKDEVHQFEQLFRLHGKKFNLISENIKTKSTRDCVNFYYHWKKSTSRNSTLRRAAGYSTLTPITTSTPTSPSIPEDTNNNSVSQSENRPPIDEQFPCKVCGRVFEKIKSRSAHMKRHKNER